MPRPQSKEELLFLAEENYRKIRLFIDELSESQRETDFPEGTLNRNVRDVIGHLYHWHLLFLTWYEIGMRGEKPAIPKEGYTFTDTPRLNRTIWEECQGVPLETMQILFEKSHRQVFSIIEKHTDTELFTKKMYCWTGSTSLGAYLVSATSSHYDWALKLLRKSLKKEKK
ncbi:ClbS/DfsB family four-helix bundle protein [Capnocytophaga sp.]|uniref:ClbS/DfsB family four-helix bundle protein n=1 Tax=Capnocytophaga sp. TaxID=44737 RepID=UPI0026DCCAA6|nr:ClbS/DfsB family four-helix bundle protein [Capnocytophaga sp.]MDO5104770.1 ClbS/DfsB family four-helix bundle protein [Capnocytophaga sp.]